MARKWPLLQGKEQKNKRKEKKRKEEENKKIQGMMVLISDLTSLC